MEYQIFVLLFVTGNGLYCEHCWTVVKLNSKFCFVSCVGTITNEEWFSSRDKFVRQPMYRRLSLLLDFDISNSKDIPQLTKMILMNSARIHRRNCKDYANFIDPSNTSGCQITLISHQCSLYRFRVNGPLKSKFNETDLANRQKVRRWGCMTIYENRRFLEDKSKCSAIPFLGISDTDYR